MKTQIKCSAFWVKYQKMIIMFSKMAVLFIMGISRKMIIIKNQAIDMHVQVIMVWYQCTLGEVLCSLRNRCRMRPLFLRLIHLLMSPYVVRTNENKSNLGDIVEPIKAQYKCHLFNFTGVNYSWRERIWTIYTELLCQFSVSSWDWNNF